MQITLDHIVDENYNIKTLWFRPERKIEYLAGQFIEMVLPHNNADSRGQKRWFTLSSSPSDNLISITTKNFGNKASTFKKKLFSLKQGDTVNIVEPMGDFVLPIDSMIPLVFIAGGIGLTPYHSMVKWLTDSSEKRQLQIILAFNQPHDIVFDYFFRSYTNDLKIVVSNPDSDWNGETGKLSAEKIFELTGGDINDKKIYVSGPEPMVENLEKGLLEHGVTKNNLVLDFFPGYASDLK